MGRHAARWLTPDNLALLRGMACMGKDEAQIAQAVGVPLDTLRRWKNRYPEIEAALSFDKDSADFAVMEALHRKAVGYTAPVKKTYKLKRAEFDPDSGKKILEYEELQTGIDETHVPADTRAEIFWLQNRRAEEWTDAGQDAMEDGGGVVELPPVMQEEDPPKST